MALKSAAPREQQSNGNLSVGFERASGEVQRRLVVCVEGLEKCGKTDFALTAPGPLYIQSADAGLEGVIQKFQGKKDVMRKEYSIPKPKPGQDPKLIADQAKEVWDVFLRDYDIALREGRSVVWDTATEFWELLRIARFGKLAQVMPMQYGPVNAEFRSLIRGALGGSANLLMLHKLKPRYVDDKRTRDFDRAGFSEAGYMAQVTVRKWKDPQEKFPDNFHMTVTDCRMNPEVEGTDLSGEMATFPWLAATVMGDMPDSWE